MSTDLICFTRGIGVINTLEGQLFKFRRPSAALIISGVALVFAMGGGAYAAVQLAPGSVTHADLAKNSVWHANIGTGAVQMNNLSTSIRKQLRKAGERGPAGPQGPAGANGSNGTNGVSSQGGGTTVIGPQGPSGVNSPLVYTYSGTTGPDSGVCSNNNGTGNAGWATDTFNTTFVVEPQSDGSYVVSKTVQGTFVTVAGVSYPLDSNCARVRPVARTGRSMAPRFHRRQGHGVQPWPRAGRSARLTRTIGVVPRARLSTRLRSTPSAQKARTPA